MKGMRGVFAMLLIMTAAGAQAQYWKLDSDADGETRMRHYNANGTQSTPHWNLAVSVANGDVTIRVQWANPGATTNSLQNTAPTGTNITLPLGDPLYETNGTTPRNLVAIESATAANRSPFATTTTTTAGANENAARRIQTITLPTSLTSIGDWAFANWTRFNSASFTTIPSTVTTLGTYVFSGWIAYNQPFAWPVHLTKIPAYTFNGWSAFNSAFTFASPSSLTAIDASAFYGWAAFNQSFTLPSSLKTIGNFAFSGWSAFNNPSFTTIPSHVTSLGIGVFQSWLAYNQPFTWPVHLTKIPAYTFYDWRAFNSAFTFASPSSVTTIDSGAFSEWVAFNNTSFPTIPSSVTTLGESVFSFWRAYNQPFAWPVHLTEIPAYTFSTWTSFNNDFTIPEGLVSIGPYAFEYWMGFNKPFALPSSLRTIGSYAFSYWESFNQDFTFPPMIQSIGGMAFYSWISHNKPFVLPASLTTCGATPFYSGYYHPYILFEGACVLPDLVSWYGWDWNGMYTQNGYSYIYAPGFTTWIRRAHLASWNSASLTVGLIEDGAAMYDSFPIRLLDYQVTYMTNGFEYATALFTNVLFHGVGSAVINPPANPAAPAGFAFDGWEYDNNAPFSNASVATNRDIVVYATFIASGPEPDDHRVRVTAIAVDPVTMDVTLEWDVTPFVPGSIVIADTKICFSDTLSDSTYGVSAWHDLRNGTMRAVIGHAEIGVSVKTADVTHAATIPGAYIADFKEEFRGTDDEAAGFFYVIVNGVLKE